MAEWRKWLFLSVAWVLLSGLNSFTLNNFQLTVSAGGPTLTVNGASSGTITVGSGSSMSIAVSGTAAYTNALVSVCDGNVATPTQNQCLFKSGAGYDYTYLNCTKTPPGSSIGSATCPLVAPTGNGSYEVALFGNNTTYPVLVVVQFSVGAAGLNLTGIAVSPNTVVTNTAYSGSLTTMCSGTCPNSPSYALVTDATACPTNNNTLFSVSGSTLSSTGFSTAGNYVACLSTTMAGVSNSPQHYPVTVSATAPTPTITVNGSGGGLTVPPGSTLTVAVKNGAGHTNDWMGICNGGVPAANNQCDGAPASYSWDYLNCSQTQPTTGVTSATCSLIAPSANGSYVANFFNQGYANIYASASFTVASGSGAGCADADMAGTYIPSLISAGWHCDPTMSDDFDQDGGVFNRSKWSDSTYYIGNLTPVVSGGSAGVCSTITGSHPVVDGQGIHLRTTAGTNATYSGTQILGTWATPAGPYYVEYKKRGDGTNLGWINADFFTENYAVAGPPIVFGGTSYPSTSTEVDFPEFGQLSWFLWAPNWGSSILTSQQNLGVFGRNYTNSANFYHFAMLRNGGNRTFYQDGGDPSPQQFADPYPVFDTSQETFVFQGYQTYPNYSCPPANSDIVYQYVHTYHP